MLSSLESKLSPARMTRVLGLKKKRSHRETSKSGHAAVRSGTVLLGHQSLGSGPGCLTLRTMCDQGCHQIKLELESSHRGLLHLLVDRVFWILLVFIIVVPSCMCSRKTCIG